MSVQHSAPQSHFLFDATCAIVSRSVLPVVRIVVQCGECGLENSRDSMPPVRGHGESENCFCRRCGTVTTGVIVSRKPDPEIAGAVVGARPVAPVMDAPPEVPKQLEG